jgi:hypothetical protein
MGDPRAQALGVVHDALARDPAVFVALQYLGMLRDEALGELRDSRQPDIVERILSVPPAPEPAYARPAVVRERRSRAPALPSEIRAGTWQRAQRYGQGSRAQRQLFVDWMENRIEWSPAVMGWEDETGE